MSYSFNYGATPPTLTPKDLGYIYPFLGLPTASFNSPETAKIYANVIPGVYNFTLSFSLSTYPSPVTIPPPSNPVTWDFSVVAVTTAQTIVTNRFLASGTNLFGGGTYLGTTVTLCTTFINTTTQDLNLNYTVLGGGSPSTILGSFGKSALCRIA